MNEQKIYMSCMLGACDQKTIWNWETIRPHAENEFRALLLMLEWVRKMQREIRMSTELGRIYIRIQKNAMRNRLMSVPGVTLKDAEYIINRAIDSISRDLYEKMGGVDYLTGGEQPAGNA